MPKRSKRYLEARKLVDRTKAYTIDEAIELLKQMPSAKFDESIELHIKTGIEPSKSDQQVRGTISLPHGTGKNVKVLVFTRGERLKKQKPQELTLWVPTNSSSKSRKDGQISMWLLPLLT
jgi:large subunit ribosomal protein L1